MDRYEEINQYKVKDLYTDTIHVKMPRCNWCGTVNTVSDCKHLAMCKACGEIYRAFLKNWQNPHIMEYYTSQFKQGYQVPTAVRKALLCP